MADPLLPGQHGQLADKEGRATRDFYGWFQWIQKKLATVTTITTETAAAVAAIPPQTTVTGSATVDVSGTPDSGYTVALHPGVLNTTPQPSGAHMLVDTDPGETMFVVVESSASGQAAIQFKDEGSNIGTSGAVTAVDFTGSGVTASHSGSTVTVNVSSGSGISSGTSNPGSPSDNDLYYRTDLDLLIFYNSGTSTWMTVQEYTLSGTTFAASPHAATATGPVRYAVPSDYGIYLTRLHIAMYVLTTSSGTQYWTLNLYQYTDAEAQIGSALCTASTISATANRYVQYDQAINTALDGTARVVYPILTKVSTPGNLYPTYSLLYRKIIT